MWGSWKDKIGAGGLSDDEAGDAGYCVLDFDGIEMIPGQCIQIDVE